MTLALDSDFYFLWFGLTVIVTLVPIFLTIGQEHWEMMKATVFSFFAMICWWLLSMLHMIVFIDSGFFSVSYFFMSMGFVFMFIGIGLMFMMIIPGHEKNPDERIFEL